jgi:GxxExxY protein
MMSINAITGDILDASMEVHRTLGPGLLESIYEKALKRELELRGHKVESQIPVDVRYKGVCVANDLRLDLIVDDYVIVELKSVEELKDVHYKQLLTYLRLLNKRVGILVNFNVSLLKKGFHRIVNGFE